MTGRFASQEYQLEMKSIPPTVPSRLVTINYLSIEEHQPVALAVLPLPIAPFKPTCADGTTETPAHQTLSKESLFSAGSVGHGPELEHAETQEAREIFRCCLARNELLLLSLRFSTWLIERGTG